MIDWLLHIDDSLFVLVNQTLSASWLDGFMELMSSKVTLIPVYVWLLYVAVKKWGKQFWMPVLMLLAAFAFSDSISSRIFKPVFKRVRPCNEAALHARTPVGKSVSYGFVSSHAANMFALAMMFGLLYKPARSGRVFAFAIAFLVAYSRVYLGLHYPGDVFFGAMLGLLVSLGLYKLFGNKLQSTG